MAEQKASSTEKTTSVKGDQPTPPDTGPVVVSNSNLTYEEAEKIREDALKEKAEEGKEWYPGSGTGGGIHNASVVIHNPDIDAPVVVLKGQPVAFESEDYKAHKAPDPGA